MYYNLNILRFFIIFVFDFFYHLSVKNCTTLFLCKALALFFQVVLDPLQCSMAQLI